MVNFYQVLSKAGKGICEKVGTPMKKFLALCLSTVLILSLLPSGARAIEIYRISDEGIAMIMEFEGYRPEPYEDRGKWYIGYGTSCDPLDFPDGVTEEEAYWLLVDALSRKEEDVNEFLLKYDISLEQHQFDVLVSLTYNLGTQWINPDYRFCSYLIDGIEYYTEEEVVNAIATWCHQGTTVLSHLAMRRLREAYLFLYGEYENDGPEAYTYIHFDPGQGEVENKTVFYPVGEAYGNLPYPDGEDFFIGWMDEDTGDILTGREIAEEDAVYVTAIWEGMDVEEEEEEEEPEIDYSFWINPYSDLKETDWFFEVVRELSVKGVVGGYPEGDFRPTGTLKAGEALKLILLAAGYEDPGNAKPGHWAANYLTLAENIGCVNIGEIPDLDAPISRGMIARIAAVAMGLEPRKGASPFADVDDAYLLALYEEKIITGSISNGQRWYLPDDNIIRSEICAVVSRISNWEYEEKNDPASSGYIKYGKKYLPVLKDVDTCRYDTNLLVKDGSIMYYNDPAYRTAIGIDVSSFQGKIDWEQVAASGVEFVMVRLGGRGYSEGALYEDKFYRQNLEGARDAGIPVGAYFFSQAISVREAKEEAAYVLELLDGFELDYPLVYDWEVITTDVARTDDMEKGTLTECAIAFCEAVADEGYTPMLYCGSRVAYVKLDLRELTEYDIWYAQYADKPTMYYNYRIWQYTDSGKVPGIEGDVDMNSAFIPY